MSVDHLGQGAARFRGRVDEARISSIARSDDWIKTAYQNLANPTDFCRLGEEKLTGGHSAAQQGRLSQLTEVVRWGGSEYRQPMATQRSPLEPGLWAHGSPSNPSVGSAASLFR